MTRFTLGAKAARALKAAERERRRKLRRRLSVIRWKIKTAGAHATRDRLEAEKHAIEADLAGLPEALRDLWREDT